MRYLNTIAVIAFAGIPFLSIAQPPSESAKKYQPAVRKIYFPATTLKDSAAMDRAMPQLADQILTAYKEPDRKKYFEKAMYYQLMAGHYDKAITAVDSAQQASDDKATGIEITAYAAAKMKSKTSSSFDEVFKKAFSMEFEKLSFRKKVSLALFDTSALKGMKKDYTQLLEKMAALASDSLTENEAEDLCEKYCYSSLYSRIASLMWAVTDKREYRPAFPAIRSIDWAGVVPVHDVDEIADPALKYKFLFELTSFGPKDQPDSVTKKEINTALGIVARQLNLHEGAGVPRKNIQPVIVVHAAAINAFLNNEKYKKRYGIDNPNIPVIKELQAYGVKIIACGQLMTYASLEMNDLLPGIKQAVTAQTVISSYQLKGFVYYDLNLDR